MSTGDANPLSPESRESMLEWCESLGDETSQRELLAFVFDHLEACLSEAARNPGNDLIRLGILWATAKQSEETDRTNWLSLVKEALDSYPRQVQDADPFFLQQRHPAWVGLCTVLVGELAPHLMDSPVDTAARYAGAGFSKLTQGVVETGDVLWALAEKADELGWHPMASGLLESAVKADFSDPNHRHQVRLLLAAHQADVRAAIETLTAVVDDETATPELHIQANFTLGHLLREDGRIGDAQDALQRALELAKDQGDEAIVGQIQEVMN